MTLNEYQVKAATTAIYPKDVGLVYTVLGLASEAGEVAGKLKKIYRDFDGILTSEQKIELANEAMDCVWYASQILKELDITFETAAQTNIEKLISRRERGVIKGNGDNR